jgi:hypothetical protein
MGMARLSFMENLVFFENNNTDVEQQLNHGNPVISF